MANESPYFIVAEEIKKVFTFFGNYYQDSSGKKFRNVICYLPIKFKDSETFDITSYSFDALFIMMNPGGSKPQNGLFPSINTPKFGLNKLVSARPDQTQYQVARIAIAKGWKSVCIINLSDIVEAKSKVFIKNLAEAPVKHTIFSEERIEELEVILSLIKNKKCIYAAWGIKTDSYFQKLAESTIQKLKKYGITPKGLNSKSNTLPFLFQHPLPSPQPKWHDWLNDFMREIK